MTYADTILVRHLKEKRACMEKILIFILKKLDLLGSE
jgi:hypothetical protein